MHGVEDGISFYKARGEWQDRDYIPKAGDIIFFDWADDGRDGRGDHVGIVEYAQNDKVHTVEGNSSDECRQRVYNLDSLNILGYGTPMY